MKVLNERMAQPVSPVVVAWPAPMGKIRRSNEEPVALRGRPMERRPVERSVEFARRTEPTRSVVRVLPVW